MSPKSVDQDSVDLSSLPSLPGSWVWCIPADVCSVIASGSTPKPDEMYAEAGDVPFIKVYNLTHRGVLDFSVKPTFIDRSIHLGLLARSRVLPDDVLINIVGPPLGKVAIVPSDHPEWNINQAVVVFRPEAGVLNKYLAFAFLTDSIMRRVTSLAKATAGQFNIGVGMCRRLLPLPMAPTNEQRRIVAKIEELFSDLDAGEAALKRAKANLKRYRAAVLKAAVEGKLTEEWRAKHPAKEPASSLLARILKERRQKWEADQLAKFAAAQKEPPKNWRDKYVEPSPPDTSGLHELPEGWCWVALGQMAQFQNGRAFPSNEYTTQGVKLLRPGNLFADGTVRWSEKNSRFMPPEWAETYPTYIVRGNELVMNLTAQSLADEFLGRVCLTRPDESCLLNQRLARIMPLDSLDKRFALYLLKSAVFRLFVNGLNTGSLIEHMFTSQLETCCLPLPPLAEQQEIVQEVERRLSIVEDNDVQINSNLARATSLRQSILKQAFEGKLVPQDPKDETASTLLARLAENRTKVDHSATKPKTTRRKAKS